MRHSSLQQQNCSIARTVAVLGERWTLVILREAFNRRRRFDDIQRDLGIARNILADRLQTLVAEGILERRAYQQRPERFEYLLSEKGLDLWPVLVGMLHWGDRHLAEAEGPPMLVRHKRCDGLVDDRGYCEKCGKRLSARDAYTEYGPGAPAEWKAEAAA